ncbi:UNVERIFIED_CONTAM: hypothetical protein GTU68_053084, partial [Idotea baltica]|nr:hypothetical protein [Idotea baltica]
QIVVGTPGRVLDLIKRRILKLNEIKWVVLDEADEMLNMGFQEDLDSILSETPDEKQTLLFSATMPPAIARISKRYMTDPAEISVGERNSGAKNVQHEFYMVHARYRYEALRRIVDMNSDMYAIIFCRTRSNTNEVARKLGNDGYEADAINGDLSQAQRDQVMGRFRNRQIQFLVATDVAARGIDIDDLTHVINYELPDELEVYVHRSGRTGRAGKSGISMSIIHTRETRAISMLERMVQKRFERKPIPSGKDICEQQLLKLVDKIEKVEVDESQIEPFLPGIYEKLSWLSREELIKHVISVEFNRFIAHYKNAPDLNRSDSRERGGRRSSTSFSRFHINLGSKHELNPNRLMGLINEQTQNKNVRIGKIDIMKKFSFFEIESQFSSQLPELFQGASFEGTPAIIQPAEPDVKGEAKSKRPFHDRFGKKKKDKRKSGGDRERRKRK